MTEKVIQLFVKKDLPEHELNLPSLAVTMDAQIKYCDDEVVLVKLKFDVGGQVSKADHVLVQTPKK